MTHSKEVAMLELIAFLRHLLIIIRAKSTETVRDIVMKDAITAREIPISLLSSIPVGSSFAAGTVSAKLCQPQ